MTHYYSPTQTSKLIVNPVRQILRGKDFEILCSSGVFSSKAIDYGTQVLVNNAIVVNGWKVLDLGCGCGVVGIVVAEIFPKCKVVMSDVNKRAVYISSKNMRNHGLENVEVVESDLFKKIDDTDFDTIITNPPMVAGRELCYKIIEESFLHLKQGGVLQLVARHQKGGKMLEEKMKEVFGNVEQIAKKGGFRVYVSKKE